MIINSSFPELDFQRNIVLIYATWKQLEDLGTLSTVLNVIFS